MRYLRPVGEIRRGVDNRSRKTDGGGRDGKVPTALGSGPVTPKLEAIQGVRSHRCSLRDRDTRIFNYVDGNPDVTCSSSCYPIDSGWLEVGTKGDDNCFYRAVTMAMGAHEDEFHRLREAIATYIEENRGHFTNRLPPEESMQQHLRHVRQSDGQPSLWATEVEIEALSRMLNCALYARVKEGRTHAWGTLLRRG